MKNKDNCLHTHGYINNTADSPDSRRSISYDHTSLLELEATMLRGLLSPSQDKADGQYELESQKSHLPEASENISTMPRYLETQKAYL